MISQIDILTLFPQFFDSYLSQALLSKAISKGILTIQPHFLRNWAPDARRTVDDIPYGGGPGMVLSPDPLMKAIESIRSNYKKGRVIYLSCRGKLFNQTEAKRLLDFNEILLVCGRYEGIDQRVIDSVVDEEISIGDFVLFGGEAAAVVVIDTLSRLVPGVLGKAESLEEESFEKGLLEYPHYTRPELFRGMSVPDVLLSGHHEQIRRWRLEQSVLKTSQTRPDLLQKIDSPEVKEILRRLKK